MSDTTRSVDRPPRNRVPQTPLGIKVVAALGLIGAVLGVFGGLAALGSGGPGVLLGPLVIALSVAQAVTMIALYSLTPWAWYATVILYCVTAVLDLLTVDVLGLVVAVIIAAYVYSQKDVFGI